MEGLDVTELTEDELWVQQYALYKHYDMIKLEKMLPSVSGWVASTANERKKKELPEEYLLEIRNGKVVIAFDMDTLDQQKVNVTTLAVRVWLHKLQEFGVNGSYFQWLNGDIFEHLAGILVEEQFKTVPIEFQRILYWMDTIGHIQKAPIVIDYREPASEDWMDAPQGLHSSGGWYNRPWHGGAWYEKSKRGLLSDGGSSVPSFTLARARHEISHLIPILKAHLCEVSPDPDAHGWNLEMAGVSACTRSVAGYLLRDVNEPSLVDQLEGTIDTLSDCLKAAREAHLRSIGSIFHWAPAVRKKGRSHPRAKGAPGPASWMAGYDGSDSDEDPELASSEEDEME